MPQALLLAFFILVELPVLAQSTPRNVSIPIDSTSGSATRDQEDADSRIEAPESWRELAVVSLSEMQRAALQKSNEALGAQIGTLNEKRQWAQTEKLVKARWPQLLQEGVGRFFWILPAYLEALQKQGKADEAATAMRQLSAFYLEKAGSWDAVWLSAWTSDALEKAGDTESALRWAKLNWLLCAHDEIQVRQAMQRLMRLWNDDGLNRENGLAWLDFQLGKTANKPTASLSSTRSPQTTGANRADTNKPNALKTNAEKNVLAQSSNKPTAKTSSNLLSKIALPKFSPLTLFVAQKQATTPQQRITLLLVKGDFLAAIGEARSVGLDKSEGALEACRILRAASGNLREANAWIAFAKRGGSESNGGRDALSALQNRLQRAIAPKSATSSTRSADSIVSNPASQGGFLTSNDVQPIRLQAAVLPVAVALMRADLVTGEEAYERGALNVADIEEMVTAGGWQTGSWGMGDWGIIEGVPDVELRREVMGVIWRHDARFQKLDAANLSRIAPRVRLWVGDALYKQNDEKCVPILSSILDEVKVPVKGENPMLFSAVERLGWFYRDRGEYPKAIDAWMRMEKVHADKGWYTGDAYLESARLALQAGDVAQAKKFYAQVANRGIGFVNQVALVDQANLLVSQKQYQQASALLLPVVEQNGGGQARVSLLSVLGSSYLAAGDFTTAAKYFKKAIAEYKPQEDSGGAASPAMFVDDARQGLATAERWSKAVFDVPLKNLLATRDAQGVYRARLYVHSFGSQTVKVAFDSAAVQLVAFKKISQKRTDSLVTVSVYDLSFRMSKSQLVILKAKVLSPIQPQTSVPIEVRLQKDDE